MFASSWGGANRHTALTLEENLPRPGGRIGYAAKGILAHLWRVGTHCGPRVATLVGARGVDPHRSSQLVDRVSERVVLGSSPAAASDRINSAVSDSKNRLGNREHISFTNGGGRLLAAKSVDDN
jgi:hypothetical protein